MDPKVIWEISGIWACRKQTGEYAMTIWIKITLAIVLIWIIGMFVVASILENAGVKPDRPGHEIDCIENKTC